MAILWFDLMNLIILICCGLFVLWGSEDPGLVRAVGVAGLGLGAFFEMYRSVMHPETINFAANLMLTGIAILMVQLRWYAFVKKRKEKKEDKTVTITGVRI